MNSLNDFTQSDSQVNTYMKREKLKVRSIILLNFTMNHTPIIGSRVYWRILAYIHFE